MLGNTCDTTPMFQNHDGYGFKSDTSNSTTMCDIAPFKHLTRPYFWEHVHSYRKQCNKSREVKCLHRHITLNISTSDTVCCLQTIEIEKMFKEKQCCKQSRYGQVAP